MAAGCNIKKGSLPVSSVAWCGAIWSVSALQMSLIYFVSLLTNCHSAQANSRVIHHYIKTVTAAYAKILKLASSNIMSDHGINISVSTSEK